MTAHRVHQAEQAWQDAYQRTDLTARLIAAAISDYRALGTNLLANTGIEAQLDRYEQARELEEEAHADLEHARGVA